MCFPQVYHLTKKLNKDIMYVSPFYQFITASDWGLYWVLVITHATTNLNHWQKQNYEIQHQHQSKCFGIHKFRFVGLCNS